MNAKANMVGNDKTYELVSTASEWRKVMKKGKIAGTLLPSPSQLNL